MGTPIDDDFEAEDSDERHSADDYSRHTASRGEVDPARHRRRIERYWEQRRLRELLEDFDAVLPDLSDGVRRIR